MNITLEKIDEVRNRTNASYSQAKRALEESNGDVLDAVLFLENNGARSNSFVDDSKNFIEKINTHRLYIGRKNDVLVNLYLFPAILFALFTFPATVVSLVVALVMGYKVTIVSEKNGDKEDIFDKDSNINSEEEK